jgi:hypothetical protein
LASSHNADNDLSCHLLDAAGAKYQRGAQSPRFNLLCSPSQKGAFFWYPKTTNPPNGEPPSSHAKV